jgi:predicted O-linked N-acetylglucosamine transferase (SPINDLY family)
MVVEQEFEGQRWKAIEAFNHGLMLRKAGKLAEAAEAFEHAAGMDARLVQPKIALGNLHAAVGRLDESLRWYQAALTIEPANAETWNNLGIVRKDRGEIREALACFSTAMRAKPGLNAAYSNWLYTLHFDPASTEESLGAEHAKWASDRAAPLVPLVVRQLNDASPDRRLRIGYVSPNFCGHPVGRFVLPLLSGHDRSRFEVFAYSAGSHVDALTTTLCSECEHWRDVAAMTDDAVAATISEDRIDILVDLAMHTTGNRLLAFARRPAPVQVSYLAYPSITGITESLSDAQLGSTGTQLTGPYWCYTPPADAPDIPIMPASASVTFGCLNNFGKVSEEAIGTWAELLHQLPTSRLLLHAHLGSHRQRVLDVIERRGIANDRVGFVPFQASIDYFRTHARIDIALDPFPYAGGATTCDALWMGTPAVTLHGRTQVGRSGVSILSHAGLPELIASSKEQYIRIALSLARNPERRARLRCTLRARLQASSLMNVAAYVDSVEEVYRRSWHHWCRGMNS